MRFLVLGAGGIGGYFGGRLVENGADVAFLVRERRREQLEADGLRIESVYGNATLRVASLVADDLKPRYDVVLLTCKAYDLASAIDAVAPGLARDGCVVPLLNGIAHLEPLNARFGLERVLGGTAQIGVTLARDGTVRHLNDWRTIAMGEQGGGVSARARAIAGAFPAASVAAQASADIMQEMWEKLVHLATAASMTCLMRANVGEIVRTDAGAGLLRRTFDLLSEVATRNGHPPGDAFLARYRRIFSDGQSGYATSMLRDIEAGNRTEGAHIVGFALEKARAAGLDGGTLEIAYSHLQAYDNRRAAGRLPGRN
ncbi:MAG: 2-dehydropantoate 2-reductase [Acidimicrobiia bacterium]|nr:2-dehydropantoate 2-reductase [Acidimicrobiia bacterium]